MLKLASDADVHGAIVRALQEAAPLGQPLGKRLSAEIIRNADFVPVVLALGQGIPDKDVLEWAANEGRILLTNDRSTLIGYAYERVEKGEVMPGVIVMPPHHWRIGKALDDVLLIANVCLAEELRDQVIYLPLKPGTLPSPKAVSPPPTGEDEAE